MNGKSLFFIVFGALLLVTGVLIVRKGTGENAKAAASDTADNNSPLFRTDEEDFSQYIFKKFSKKYFEVDKTPSDLFVVNYKLVGKEGVFYVNTLWIEIPQDSMINLATDNQILKYQSYQQSNQTPFFKILGIGGKPSNPRSIYIIPVAVIKKPFVHIREITEFKKHKMRSNFFFDTRNNTLK